MALQGTIETFPLTDVLTLLGSSSKTGRLELTGDRGTGWLWVDDGRVVGGSIGERVMDDPARLLFELLRFSDGAFEFTATDHEEPAVADLDPVPLTEGILSATDLLEQWRAIEAIVPSMRHRVVLATELPDETVTVDRATWNLVVAAGRVPTVEGIAEALDLDEFDVCAAVAALVGDGLAEIDEPAPLRVELFSDVSVHGLIEDDPDVADDLDGTDGVEDRPEGDDERLDVFGSPEGIAPADTTAEEHEDRFPNRFPIDDLLGDGAMERDDPWSSPEMEQLAAQRRSDTGALDEVEYDALPPIESVPFGEERSDDESHTSRTTAAAWNDMVEDDTTRATGSDRTEEDTTDEVLRQMSKLSPKAAEAIAAALSTVPAAPAPHEEHHEDDGGSSEPSTFLGSF